MSWVKLGNRDVVKTHKREAIKGFVLKGFVVNVVVIMGDTGMSRVAIDDGSGCAATDEDGPKTRLECDATTCSICSTKPFALPLPSIPFSSDDSVPSIL